MDESSVTLEQIGTHSATEHARRYRPVHAGHRAHAGGQGSATSKSGEYTLSHWTGGTWDVYGSSTRYVPALNG